MLWIMVGGHLFGILALVHASFQDLVWLSIGGRINMGYRDMQI